MFNASRGTPYPKNHRAMADKNDEIREFLESMSDSFEIMEEGVDIQTQKDYLDYSHFFDRGKLTDKQTLQLSSILFSQETTPADKKKILVLLAHLGTIIAYRQIEKYYKNPDIELRPWATLALSECRMFLENDLTDQNKGLILSGLGAVKDKFRYYFLLLPCTEKPFTNTQNGIIKKEIHHVAKNLTRKMQAFFALRAEAHSNHSFIMTYMICK